MFGPSGVGVVYGKLDLLEEMEDEIVALNNRYETIKENYHILSCYRHTVGYSLGVYSPEPEVSYGYIHQRQEVFCSYR